MIANLYKKIVNYLVISTHKYFPASFKLLKSIIQYLVGGFCLIFMEIKKKLTYLMENVV
jgi:hypothetical protein